MLKLAFFLFQPLPALGRQRVVTCPTAGLGSAPLGFRPPVNQQSLEGWIESALANLQCVARRAEKVLRNPIAVQWAVGKRFQNEEIQISPQSAGVKLFLVMHQ